MKIIDRMTNDIDYDDDGDDVAKSMQTLLPFERRISLSSYFCCGIR